MAAETKESTIWEHPLMKRVQNGVQLLLFTAICWAGNTVASAVKGFSDKLDGVVASVSSISQEMVLQKRETLSLTQRADKTEAKLDTQGQQLIKLSVQMEQLQRDRTNGR